MSLDELLEHLKALSPEDRQRVEAYVHALGKKSAPGVAHPRQSIKGTLSNLQIDLAIEDFNEVRRDLGAEFARKIDRLGQQS
jgi:hypothetical protein